MSEYNSILLCGHSGRTEVYLNGIKLGTIVAGEFKRERAALRWLPINEGVTLEEWKQRNLAILDQLPYANLEELKAHVRQVIELTSRATKDQQTGAKGDNLAGGALS